MLTAMTRVERTKRTALLRNEKGVATNGVNIFPKLPHLLRTGVQQYQVSQKIRILGLHTEEGFNKLLGELRTDVVLENPEQQRRLLIQRHESSNLHRNISEQAAPAVSESTGTSQMHNSSRNAETTQATSAQTDTLAVSDRCKW